MPTNWNLDAATATSSCGEWKIDLDPTQPTHYAQFHSKNSVWNAVAVHPLPKHALIAEEVYARENDLISRFQQSKTDTYAFQLDWQVLDSAQPVGCAVELWVSIQTNLLDSAPQIQLSSEGAPEGWRVYRHAELLESSAPAEAASTAPPAALVSQVDGTTRVWLIEPSDQCNIQLESSLEEAVQSLKLFGHFMEKGVIRRARMRFLVADGTLDVGDLCTLYQAFAASPLPLTA